MDKKDENILIPIIFVSIIDIKEGWGFDFYVGNKDYYENAIKYIVQLLFC